MGTQIQTPTPLTQETLKTILCYDPGTGCFVWLARAAFGRNLVGRVAGTAHNNGYWSIGIAGKSYLAHRLAWLYVYGKWPVEFIDHVNRNRRDNRLCNLREATNGENLVNSGASKQNKVGVRGVYLHKSGRFRVQLGKNGSIHIGYFGTLEEATLAARVAAVKIHGQFGERV